MKNLPKLPRTFFIGLGGFGADVIIRLKSTLFDNFGEIPPMVKLLAMDVDNITRINYINKEGKDIALNDNEYVHLMVHDFQQFVRAHPDESNFFPKELLRKRIQIINTYRCLFRSGGRFTLIANDNGFFRRILAEIVNSVENCQYATYDNYEVNSDIATQIFVIFTLAGATGSGLFIDLPLLLRGSGIAGQNIHINAIGVLPDAFSALGVVAGNCESNAIAAMTEYELIADSKLQEFIPDHFHPARLVKTLGGSYPVIPANLYNSFSLINNESSTGLIYQSAQDMADHIANSLFLEACTTGGSVNGSMYNTSAFTFGQTFKGKSLRYLGLGFAEMIYDPKQVAEYYSLLQVNSICNHLLNSMIQHNNIAEEIQVCFDEWKIQKDQNRDDVINFFAGKIPNNRFAGINEFDEISAIKIKSKSESYLKFVRDSISQSIFEPQGDLGKITGRGLNNILSYASEKINTKGGLYYLKKLIPNMIGRLKEMLHEMTIERYAYQRKLDQYENICKNALLDIEKAICIPRTNIFKNRRKAIAEACDEYVYLINVEASCIQEIEKRTAALTFYNKMIEKAETIFNNIISFESHLRIIVII